MLFCNWIWVYSVGVKGEDEDPGICLLNSSHAGW